MRGFARAVDLAELELRHSTLHVVVAQFASAFRPACEPSAATCLDLVTTAIDAVGNVGEFAATVDPASSTIRLAFALREDAARLCALTRAAPARNGQPGPVVATFVYDQPLHDDLQELQRREAAKAVAMIQQPRGAASAARVS